MMLNLYQAGIKTERALRTLTDKEEEIAILICQGHSNAAIGGLLGISELTVKVHNTHIFKKFGCKNRTQLALRVLGYALSRAAAKSDERRGGRRKEFVGRPAHAG